MYRPTSNKFSMRGYHPFGMILSGRSWEAGSGYRFGFNGKEQDNEVAGNGNIYDYGFRIYNSQIGRFLSIDPMAQFREWVSPYNFCQNNPINRVDPTGAVDDWVQDKTTNEITWDKNANSEATTKEGKTYLGKTLTFTFNSYIDGANWDGPNPLIGPSPIGDKLTSTISITGSENATGDLIDIIANRTVIIGETPWGNARDYYPGLGSNQNKFGFNDSQFNSEGVLTSTSFNFEQHASVSKFEEIGMHQEGYNIVNVAQKLNLEYSENTLSVSTYTDVFPSATLTMNGSQMMYYKQPSFRATHSLPILGYTAPSLKDNIPGGRPIYDYSYKPARWYKR